MSIMKVRVSKFSAFLVTSALTTTLMGFGAACAQSTGDGQPLETVVVTGVRASIERAVNI